MPLKKRFTKASQVKSSTAELKEELLQWICERHATNRPLDRQLLRKKALDLAASLNLTGFKCSEAWLTVFLKKHGFSPSLTNCSGPTFPDYRVWIDLLRSLITQYRYKDLFVVDELVMYSDFMPGRLTVNTSERHQHGDFVANQRGIIFPTPQANRIGIMLCSNSSGTEKLPPLISGPYNPDNSRNYSSYHQNEDSSITDEIFDDWLFRFNADMSKLDRKILLLLNRERIRATKKSSSLSHVNLLYFPKDFPAKLKPLRGDVFHCVKMIYRSRYVQHVRSFNVNKNWGANEIVESISLGWKNVSQDLIISSFRRTKLREDESCLKINCPGWDDLDTGISFKQFVTFDDDLSDRANRSIDDLETLAREHKHHYNLRNCFKGTVLLDEFGTILEQSRLDRNKSREIGDIRRERFDRRVRLNKESQVGLGLTRKIGQDESDAGKGPEGSERSNIPGEDIRSDEETNRRPHVDGSDFFKVGNSSARDSPNEDEEPSSSSKNCESFENSFEMSCRQFEIMRGLSHCSLSDGDREGKLSGEDVEDLDLPSQDSIREVHVDFNLDEGRTRSMGQDEVVRTCFGQPGPSSNRVCVRVETFGDANSTTGIRRFDDEGKNAHNRSTESTIPGANDCLGAAGSSGNDENVELSRNDNPRPCKRPGDGFDESQPIEKRSRSDCSWVKRYETDFVFGPDLGKTSNDVNEASSGPNVGEIRNHETVTKSKKIDAHGNEIDKRCVFAIEGTSLGLPFPATKD